MSHDPQDPHPLDQGPPPHGEIDPPRPQAPPRIRRKPADAIGPFQKAHEILFGVPSGKTTWDIRVCSNPRYWHYQAEQKSAEKHGPPTPLQILGRDKNPTDRNITTTTDLYITACIGWHWAEDFPTQVWEEAVLRAQPKMIVLGAHQGRSPTLPADKVWRLTAIYKDKVKPRDEYCGKLINRYCLALGNHAVITESETATDQLIDHIKKTADARMNGRKSLSSKGFDFTFIDEVNNWTPGLFQITHSFATPRVKFPTA